MPIDQSALDSLRLERAPPVREEAARPRRKRLVAFAVGLGVLLAFGAWFALPRGPAVEAIAAENAATGSGPTATAVLNASGYVVARRMATVSSEVTGKVAQVLVEEGMTVEAGQVLARLDDETARAQAEVARRQLEAARRNLAEVEIRLADARRTLERRRSLRGDGLVSQNDVDAAEAEAAALAARLEALSGETAVAESNLDYSRVALRNLVIRAPFAGVVTSKDAQPGEMVSPVSAGGGFTRTGIATVVDMDSREIEVDVNEAFINRVRAGQRVQAVLDAYPDWVIPAHVINIVPAADRQKATVRVRVAFDALEPRILPDMGVKVQFLGDAAAGGSTSPAEPVAGIPASALARDGEQAIVWVIKGSIVERRAVRVGGEQAGRIEIVAGLRPGELVVSRPPPTLVDGGRVRVKASS
jgi:RND family efflux transporter MFP subunit